MTNDKLAEVIRERIAATPYDDVLYSDYMDLMENCIRDGDTRWHSDNAVLREQIKGCLYTADDVRMLNKFDHLYKRSLLIDAPVNFDCFCRYIEFDREPDKKFYAPRAKALKGIVDALQDMADDKLDLCTISLPPGVGKTTIAIFYLMFIAGRDPDKPILGGSHNNSFLRGVYDECLRILMQDGEYLWRDVFPTVSVVDTNAKDFRIDLGTAKRFQTLEFSSIGSGNAGKVRAESLLYCDDLVEGIEQALSKERMDKLWEEYTTDLRQRKIGNCKELHIATRWSVHDVIGRLQRHYEGSSRARFIAVPALNEQDESNFDYGNHSGFTTAFYHEQREVMDDASWKALYMNEPIEREGLLYREDELRRFFDLPSDPPDGIIGVCDTKDKGEDYAVLPVAYIYGHDYYIADVICDNNKPEIVDVRLEQILMKHNVQMCRFESNSAGGRVAKDVQEAIKRKNGITHIQTKFTTSNKETKIIVNSAWVKEHCLFKDKSVIQPGSDYQKFINMLCSYTMMGKNKHDDAPDGMAMLAEFAQSLMVNRVEIVERPF